MDSILPIRVTPSEKYFITDDRPGYRMSFFVDHSFIGEMDRDGFDAGLAAASERHPLLNALLERRSFGRCWWVPPGEIRPLVNWGGIDVPIRIPADPIIDLTREVGVRVYVRVGNGKTRMLIQFHHACCDGVGAIQYLSDLLTGYVRKMLPNAQQLPTFQPTDPRKLQSRDKVWAHWENIRELGQIAWGLIKSLVDHEIHPPVPIAAPSAGRTETEFVLPCTLTRTLEPGVHATLRKIARMQEVTVHELMVRELLMTIREWNIIQGTARDSDWISVIVPANTRTFEQDGLPAANVVGCTSFLRSTASCSDAAALLDSIRAESAFHRRTRFPATFTTALKILDWIPGGAKFMTGRDRCCASAFLSSVGDPSRAIAAQYPVDPEGSPIMANLILKDVNSAPALRYMTRAAFANWHYNGKQRLGIRCDPTVFSEEQAAKLLQIFADRVVALAASGMESQVPTRRAA